MPAAFNEIGVKCVTAALVENVDVQKQVEHKILKKNDGAFETGNRFDPSFTFTVKGRGLADEALLGGASAATAFERRRSCAIIRRAAASCPDRKATGP